MPIFDKLPRALRPDRSLVARLVGSFLTVSVLTVGFVAFVAFVEARRALHEAIADRLTTVAVDKEGEVVRWVDQQRDLTVFLADLPVLRDDAMKLKLVPSQRAIDARERIEKLLRGAIGARSDLAELSLLSSVGGEVIASTNPARLGNYRVNDLFYTRGKTETFIQNVYTSPVTGRTELTIATPIFDAAGTTIAVLAGHLDLAYLDRLMADRTGLGSTGEAYLVSAANDFVSADRFGREEFRRGVFSEGITAALGGTRGVGVYTNYAGTPVIGAYRFIAARDLALLVEMRQDEAFAPARRLVVTILGIGLLSALLLAGGVVFIARQIARPVLAIAQAATSVAEGDFTTVAPVLTNDEVGVLATAFNEMTARLQSLYTNLNEQVQATTRTMLALEESQHLLQAITDNSTALITVTDPENRFLLINKSFEAVLGRPQSEALGQTPADVLPGEIASIYALMTKTAWETRHVVDRELSFSVDNELRTYFAVAFPLGREPSESFGVGVVATDLTDAKHAQETRQHLEAQVQHTQKLESLGLMAGGIAHDFNNILTSLLGNTELALNYSPEGSRTSAYLEKVVAGTKQAANLTNQMLAYAGKASFHQEAIDLNVLVQEMAELVRVSIPKKINFWTELSTERAVIQANRGQLSQLVMNLITNAGEAIGDQSGDVTVRTQADGEAVRLEISDTGSGMDEQTRERIFDPFFSTKGPGRGLGLAAVQGIVKSAGASLRVESAPSRGSLFEVDFPAAKLTPAADDAPEPVSKTEQWQGTILVVDDEPVVREMARELLEVAGFDVIEASDGHEAVDRFRSQGDAIDAILLDMTMPGMNGAEALAEIRKIEPHARVILTSGYDGQDTVASLSGAEGVAFLQKPYRARTLIAKLASVLENKDHEALKR